jgi:hypothetical protein
VQIYLQKAGCQKKKWVSVKSRWVGTQAIGWFDTYRGNTYVSLPYVRRVLRTGCGRVGYRVSELKDTLRATAQSYRG